MKKRNYIIFSSINWSTHWQIHHQLVDSIINSGGSVLFVENTGVRSPQAKDFGRIIDRLKIRIKSTYGFNKVNDQLAIYSPIFIPYPYNKIAILINSFLLSNAVKKWMRAANFFSPVCISFLPTPSIQKAINAVNPELTIYYCADDMSRSVSNPGKMHKYEDIFFRNADLVFVTSHNMYDKASILSNHVFNIPAGIDSKKFTLSKKPVEPEDIKHISRPIIGYVGAISDVFDQGLVVSLAKFLPQVSIILVGPKFTNINKLKNIENIYLLGERDHDLIPGYINSFDIALIPYVVNEATNSVYSCKLNEYLSLGKPIVSTNLREIEIFNNNNSSPICIGNSVESFISCAVNLLSPTHKDSEVDKINRINIAKENTWDKRFAEIYNAVEGAIKLKTKKSNKWKELLSTSNKKYRYFILRVMFFMSFIYLFIFNSPLFWLIGEQLIVKDQIKRSDAIVVFSGDGEIDYRNSSYQKRALEAVKIYNDGYVSSIFLSSGREQTIADVEMIKLYLTSRSIPESSIHILDKYPNSTFQNVKMVNEILERNNVNSIIFLTSPYHSLRASLIWKEFSPKIDLTTPDSRDPLDKDIQWGIGLDKMKVIMYECVAIMHNWIFGRI